MRRSGQPVLFIVLLLVLATLAPPASASNTWSDTDPVVLIVTPGGNQVPVYVDNGTSPAAYLAAAQVAQMSYTVKPAGNGTQVTLTSTVACMGGSYETRDIISTAPFATGAVYGQAYGTCGQPMTITFKLDAT